MGDELARQPFEDQRGHQPEDENGGEVADKSQPHDSASTRETSLSADRKWQAVWEETVEAVDWPSEVNIVHDGEERAYFIAASEPVYAVSRAPASLQRGEPVVLRYSASRGDRRDG